MVKEVMSIRDAADYLGLSRNTVYRLVRSGEIPAKRFGNQWRISKAVLDKFLTEGEQK